MPTLQQYSLAIIIQEQRRGNAVKQVQRELKALKHQLKETSGSTEEATEEMEDMEEQAEDTGKKIKTALISALVLASAAAAKFATESIKEFAQFDQKIKETFTLIPDASEDFKDRMSEDIQHVGQQFGILTDDAVPALYQALSAGLDKSEAVAAVGVAAKAAVGGVAELEGTMKTGMAVFNAYGGEGYELTQIYDILFTLIKNGVITMDEINSSLSRVTAVAAESRTPFEDIAAALVVMTRQGDSAAEATELLSFLLIQLGVEGSAAAKTFFDAVGMGYRQWIAEGNTLIEGLQILDQYAIDAGKSLAGMIGGDTKFFRDMQAGRAIVEVTGLQMENMVEQAENMANAAGSMDEAFATASDNVQFKMDRASASVEGLKIHLGELILHTEFLGRDGVSLITGFTSSIQLLSRALSEQAVNTFKDSIPDAPTIDDAADALARLDEQLTFKKRLFLGPSAVKELISAGLDLAAQTASTYEEFERVAIESGFAEDRLAKAQTGGASNWEFKDPEKSRFLPWNMQRIHETRVTATDESTKSIYNNVRAMAAATEAENLLAYSHRTTLDALEAQRPRRLQDIVDQEAYAAIVRKTSLEIAMENDARVAAESTWMNQNSAMDAGIFIIQRMRDNLHQMTDAQKTFMDTLRTETDNMKTAYADFQEANGEWAEVTIDNTHRIQSASEELAGDLTNEQRDMYEEILDNAEEGGARWLEAYAAIQGDLSRTQRHGLVNRLADLRDNHGETINVLNMDREAAEAAGTAVLEAYEAINEAWLGLAQEIATSKIQEELQGETEEAALAVLALDLAMGDIDKNQFDFLSQQLENSRTLKPIMDEMLVPYLADAELSAIEAQNLADVIDIVGENAATLTNVELRNLINESIDPIDGIPAIGGIIHDMITLKMEEAAETTDEFVEAEHIPVIELDTTEFDEGTAAMWVDILALTQPETPHIIEFAYKVVGGVPSAPSGPPERDSSQHTGTSGFTVPGGYNNDDFVMGLSSGEFVTVKTPGQQEREGHGGTSYVDNRNQSVYMVNNGAGAAAVARAWLEMKRRSRINGWLGG